MKRTIITVILALAVVFSLTQCKKKIETVTPGSQGGVYLTVNVNSNYKANVDPSGTVDFETGDFLFVMNGTSPVGVLEYGLEGHDSEFSGIIGPGNELNLPATLDDEANLAFIYTGSLLPNSDYTIDIWDQRDGLPVLSCGDTGDITLGEIIEDGGSIPNLELKNKCALVKFTLNQSTEDNVRIFNVQTVARFVVTGNGIDIEPTGERGYIILNNKGANNERWGILLPGQEAMPTANASVGYTKYTSSANIPEIKPNGLHNATINNSGDGESVGAVFSVDDEKWVTLAPGNVQYKASTNTWRFAENQWDYVGGYYTELVGEGDEQHLETIYKGNVYEGGVKSNNNSIADGYTGWIDLFGWGTGEEPTKYIIDTYDDPAPGTGQETCVYSVFNDWGKHLGDGYWFTLDKGEWEYLINNRTNHDIRANKIGPATVNGVEGLVILPDVFPAGLSFTPVTIINNIQYQGMYQYNLNEYNDETTPTWSAMEAAGAVFLPAAGYRMGQDYIRNKAASNPYPASLYLRYQGPGSKGYKTSYGLYCVDRMWVDDCFRCEGLAVRLAHRFEL